MKKPVRNQTYTYCEICKLYLRDSPHLSFDHQYVPGVIQNSHMTEDEMLSVPLMSESKWIYVRETDEWIPIFRFSSYNTTPITDLVDLEKLQTSKSCSDVDFWWATPKGFPRPQEE
jgi:hypothetical protein